MSTGLTPIPRRGGLGTVWRALAALTVLLLVGIVVLAVADRGPSSPSAQGVTGSGVAATQVRSLPPLSGVDLTGSNNVLVRVGAQQSVIVHADSNLLGRVTTQVSSGMLVIGNTRGSFSTRSPMFVVVRVPSLDSLSLQGSGNISVTGVKSPSLVVRIPGSGTIRATGTAARVDVAIGGSGTALLSRLTTRDATASIAGSGSIVLTATHSLIASISGSGTILYTGNPLRVTKSVTGSGTINGQ